MRGHARNSVFFSLSIAFFVSVWGFEGRAAELNYSLDCDVATGPLQGTFAADQTYNVDVGDVITITTYFCRSAVPTNTVTTSTVFLNSAKLVGQTAMNGVNTNSSGDPWTSPSDTFVVTINDAKSFNFSAQDYNNYHYIEFKFNVSPPANAGPTADAGADQDVDSKEVVTLDGTGSSDPDVGDTLTYAWTQTAGTTVTLSDTGAASPTFTAPQLGENDAAVTLTFSLVVTDDKSNASVADTVDITVSPRALTPASEFAADQAAIREVIQGEAVRGLQSTIEANERMTRNARGRFISKQHAEDAVTEDGDVPLDVSGNLDVNRITFGSRGTFSGAQSMGDGTQRLVFGDFDVQHDGETGSSTATLTGRMAWERMISEQTMLGYFVGGELARSDISDAFAGDLSRFGVTIGGYVVHELTKNTYLDSFITFGAGRNNLEMANDVLELESDYTARSVTFGGALSGAIEQSGYEIRPELSFSYGRTRIGDVGFTASAYGLVDNTLSLDAGSVTLANTMFRPEFRVPLDGLSAADSRQLFTFAPRLICEQIKTAVTEENCGGGAEIGLAGQFSKGLSTYSAKISANRLGNRTSSSLQLNLEHRF